MKQMFERMRMGLVRCLLGGECPICPSDAIWELIDRENQKPENEIRCDRIEAWEEAAGAVRNFYG